MIITSSLLSGTPDALQMYRAPNRSAAVAELAHIQSNRTLNSFQIQNPILQECVARPQTPGRVFFPLGILGISAHAKPCSHTAKYIHTQTHTHRVNICNLRCPIRFFVFFSRFAWYFMDTNFFFNLWLTLPITMVNIPSATALSGSDLSTVCSFLTPVHPPFPPPRLWAFIGGWFWQHSLKKKKKSNTKLRFWGIYVGCFLGGLHFYREASSNVQLLQQRVSNRASSLLHWSPACSTALSLHLHFHCEEILTVLFPLQTWLRGPFTLLSWLALW